MKKSTAFLTIMILALVLFSSACKKEPIKQDTYKVFMDSQSKIKTVQAKISLNGKVMDSITFDQGQLQANQFKLGSVNASIGDKVNVDVIVDFNNPMHYDSTIGVTVLDNAEYAGLFVTKNNIDTLLNNLGVINIKLTKHALSYQYSN